MCVYIKNNQTLNYNYIYISKITLEESRIVSYSKSKKKKKSLDVFANHSTNNKIQYEKNARNANIVSRGNKIKQ